MSERAKSPSRAQRQVEIVNRLGLHARAATLLVQTVAKYEAEITIAKDRQEVNGKSIIGLMMLAAGRGSIIEVRAEGPDAAEAVRAITTLVREKFNEES